jgi:hypothetical protein
MHSRVILTVQPRGPNKRGYACGAGCNGEGGDDEARELDVLCPFAKVRVLFKRIMPMM